MLEETLREMGIEESPNIIATMKLGFGKCKLCLLKPKSLGKVSAEEFIGKRIVTSFPYTAKSYFDSLAAACADGTKPSETKIKCGPDQSKPLAGRASPTL